MYWINKTFDTEENQFNQTIKVALYNVAEKMAAFNNAQLPNENPVKQVSSNYYVVDINDIIDAHILDHYLKTEFEYSHIHTDYEYAIYDCENNEMVYGNFVQTSESKADEDEKSFPKYDEYTYYFGIYFPSKTTYVLYNMNVWLISLISCLCGHKNILVAQLLWLSGYIHSPYKSVLSQGNQNSIHLSQNELFHPFLQN